MSAFTRALSSALIRSVLLSRIMSAQRSWSSNTSSSGLSCSTDGSAARWAASASGSSAKKPAATAGPSTTAITPSTVTRERIAGQLNAVTSGFGRARPEVSIRMCSGGFGRSRSFVRAGTKSSATVQQMQPLGSSTMSSSVQPLMPQPSMNEPSKPISPNSLTSTARRRPSAFCRRLRTSVVLPAPRKPVTMVQGILVRSVMQVLSDEGGKRRRSARGRPCDRKREESHGPHDAAWQVRGSSVFHLLDRSNRAGIRPDGRVSAP